MKKTFTRIILVLEIIILTGILALGGINIYMMWSAGKKIVTMEELCREKL